MSKIALLMASAMAAAVSSVPANALNIILHADSSFASAPNGAQALYAFRKAANFWNQTLTNNVTLDFAISYENLGNPNIIGQTGSARTDVLTSSIYDQLAATQTSALDATAVAHLFPLTSAGGLGYRMPSPAVPSSPGSTDGLGLNTAASIFDNDDTYNNRVMYANTANLKALGFDFGGAQFNDAEITFNSTFAFDLDPTDGISTGTQDFTSVAIHEMGHALGFVSGADFYDVYGNPNGPCDAQPGPCGFNGNTDNWDNESVLSVLDLFRYASSTTNGVRQLQLDPNRNAFFSIDGTTPFIQPNQSGPQANETPFFSTGQYNGDGSQASHWKDAIGYFDENNCFVGNRQIGIMDPTSGSCQVGRVTANDLAAFDAIGYNLNFDVMRSKDFSFDTGQVFGLAGLAAVPEPTEWGMFVLGFGLLGGAIRNRSEVKARITYS